MWDRTAYYSAQETKIAQKSCWPCKLTSKRYLSVCWVPLGYNLVCGATGSKHEDFDHLQHLEAQNAVVYTCVKNGTEWSSSKGTLLP